MSGAFTGGPSEDPIYARGVEVCIWDVIRDLSPDTPFAANPAMKTGKPWYCVSQADFFDNDYSHCTVEVRDRFFVDLDQEVPEGAERERRVFSGSELSYRACREWCIAHRPEEDEGHFDTIRRCTGEHLFGIHPAYDRP